VREQCNRPCGPAAVWGRARVDGVAGADEGEGAGEEGGEGCCFCEGVVDLVGVRSGDDWLLEWPASRSRFELSCIVEAVEAVEEDDRENELFSFLQHS